MPKERVGLMGGSFNPIHERHLEIAMCAMREQKLDRVIFLPTGNPPHKHDGLATAEDRYEMTRLCVSGIPGFSASRIEIDREGVIYTVDTLSKMQSKLPGAELFYIIGEDTMHDLPNWRNPDRVFELCRFLVCRRESNQIDTQPIVAELEARGARFAFLSLPPKDVSATAIRSALMAGEEPTELRPQVMAYIQLMGLYGVKPLLPNARELYQKLKKELSEKRLTHSLLVCYTAVRLAKLHGIRPETAALAGLLHDCAKCMPLSTLQRIAKDARLLLDKETLQSENLLHGPVGAVVAEREYGAGDPNVLSAIRGHTTGKVGMLPLDMVVYLADKIEPSRRSYPALETVRSLAQSDLLAAMRYSLTSTLAYVSKQKTTPHPTTRRVADWLARMEAGMKANQGEIVKEQTE